MGVRDWLRDRKIETLEREIKHLLPRNGGLLEVHLERLAQLHAQLTQLGGRLTITNTLCEPPRVAVDTSGREMRSPTQARLIDELKVAFVFLCIQALVVVGGARLIMAMHDVRSIEGLLRLVHY